MNPFRLIVCLFVVVWSAQSQGQSAEPSVLLGSHKIRLGVAADKLFATLEPDFMVQTVKTADGSHTLLWVGHDKMDLPVGEIYAKGNVVVGVDYLLSGREIHTAQEVFSSMYAAASKLSDEGRNTCTVTNNTTTVPPDLSKSAVFFSCGVYEVRLQRNDFQAKDGNTLTSFMVWVTLGNTD